MGNETTLENIWGRRERGIELPIDPLRAIFSDDVRYLLNKYPFLHLINPAANNPRNSGAKIISAVSGWKIQDYGSELLSSPGEYLFGGADYEAFLKKIMAGEITDDAGGEDGGAIVLPGAGTIVKQMFDTAAQMIQIAIQNLWPYAMVLSGTPLMQWAAWMAAEDNSFSLDGYDPDEEAQAKRRRIKELTTTLEEELEQLPSL